MVELWFGIATVMLTAYVVLDGFDFGAGALHLFVAKTDEERRQVLAAIGPFWDGNEVWLLATGAPSSRRSRECWPLACPVSTSRSSSCCGS